MNEIDQAVKILKKGGIIIFPTDTAFGIGCLIDNKEAIERLFEIRKRPKSQATPVLASSLEMVRDYVVEVPYRVEKGLINKYWPGALTIILAAKKEKVPSLVRGGGENVGFRIPASEKILEVIKRCGVPILGPSANFHGEKTPHHISELNEKLLKKVDFFLSGETNLNKASTVIDCSSDKWEIIRQGAVDLNL